MGTPHDNTAARHAAGEENGNTQGSRPAGTWYEIRVRGQLGPSWSDWFAGLELKLLEDGEMVLCGHIVDQAALIGLLIQLNRLNLALLSVGSLGA